MSNKGVNMADVDKETVVVEGERRSSYGWLIVLGVILLLVILFFALGGFNMFDGAANNTETINVDAPTVEVQPNTEP